MTETAPVPAAEPSGERPARERRPRRRKPSPFPVAAGSAASFLGLFGLIAFQLRVGNDPALGNNRVAPTPAAAAAAKKRVVVKRIEKKIIVTRVLPAREAPRGRVIRVANSGASARSAPAVTVPAVRSAPAPAPARAPAPVVTRAS